MARQNRSARIVGVLLLVAVVALSVAGVVTLARTEKVGADGCRESGARDNQAVLLDGSDYIDNARIDQILDLISEFARESDTNRKLWIFMFGGGKETDILPLFGQCSNANLNGALTGAKYREEMEGKFRAAIGSATARLGKSQRPQSPILEGVDRLLFKSALFSGGSTDLVLVTDALQNTAVWSMYPGSPSYHDPADGTFPSRHDNLPNKWSSVTIMQLQRPKYRHLQTAALDAWLVMWFSPISQSQPVIEKL